MAYSYCWCCETSGILYCGSGNNKIQKVALDLGSSSNDTTIAGNSFQRIDFDDSGNVFVGDGNEFYKFGSGLGSATWNISFGTDGSVYDVAVDVTNSWVYGVGNPLATTKCVRKYDLDGNEITTGGWPYDLGTSTTGSAAIPGCCALDSNLDLWVGHYPSTGTGNPSLTKLDYTGSKIADYQPFPIAGSHYEYPRFMVIDSNDNIYVALSILGFGSVTEHIQKLDSSATKVWGKTPDSGANSGYGVAFNFDEDLIAVCTGSHPSTGDDVYVYNDSGTLQWSDRQGHGVNNACVYDEDDNLYVATGDNSAPRDSVVKYNDSGTQVASIDLTHIGQSLAYKPA